MFPIELRFAPINIDEVTKIIWPGEAFFVLRSFPIDLGYAVTYNTN